MRTNSCEKNRDEVGFATFLSPADKEATIEVSKESEVCSGDGLPLVSPLKGYSPPLVLPEHW